MRRILCLLALFGLAMTPAAKAEVTITAVHGIAGALVDVYVNGGLLLPNFEFGTITDPLTVPAGTYDVEVFGAGQGPGSGEPIIGLLGAALPDGLNVSLVAHLDEEGAPVLTPFANDVSPVVNSGLPQAFRQWSRVTVRHAAAAPKVRLTVGPLPRVSFSNGQDVTHVAVRTSTYWVWLNPALDLQAAPVFGPVPLELQQEINTIVYAVGSIEDGTFTVLVQTIDLSAN